MNELHPVPQSKPISLTVRCVMLKEKNGPNQNKQPREVGSPSPGRVIAQDESLSKHMRKMVRVGGTARKGEHSLLARSFVYNVLFAP